MEYSPLTPGLAGGADPSPRPAAASGNLGGIIERVTAVVDAETAAIGTDRAFDLKESNTRKSRCLLELSRAAKGLRAGDLLPEHREGLRRLRDCLGRNERAVRAHLDAVGEVAALLGGAIRQAQSDGTYGGSGWGR